VPGVPEDVERLLAERQRARGEKDFARSDAIRDKIYALGYDIRDSASGATLEKRAAYETVDPARVESVLDHATVFDASIHLLYEGFKGDVERFLAGLTAHPCARSYEVVVVDNASPDGEWLESLANDRVRVMHLDREVGYAQARNAGLKTSRGRVVILVDLSVEPTGDIVTPLVDVLSDPEVGVAGPWGLATEDLHEFTPAIGDDVVAIEGYLLATRRELLAKELIREKFRWYRHADIDLSYQLRALGPKACVVDVPAVKHLHRGWDALSEDERAKRSKKNWNLFFDRWKHPRHDH